MRILLINPPRLYYKDSLVIKGCPPLGLAYIAGALKAAGYDVSVFDALSGAPDKISEFSFNLIQNGLTNEEVVQRIDSEYDIIGMGCMFTDNWLSNRVLLNLLKGKFPNTKIVIGGEHASAAAEMCLQQAHGVDVVAIGEGEETIVEIVKAYEQGLPLSGVLGISFRDVDGQIVHNEHRKRIKDLNSIARPAWDLFPLKTYFEHSFSYGINYGNSFPILATRGCPFSCTFCSSPQMWGTKYSMRSTEDVFDEIQYLYQTYNVTNFDFYDLTAIIQKKWIIEFAQRIIDSGIKITWQIPAGTRSEAIDEEVIQYLYLSGCKNIAYAPESGSLRVVLKDIKKKVSLDRMIASINSSYKAGLNVKLNMIVGFPEETHSDMWKTIWFMIRATWYGAHDAWPSIFSPYPGSAMFEQLREKGVIKGYDDEYFINIVKGATYFSNPGYSLTMHKYWLVFYSLFGTLLLYMFSYLFRPLRLYKNVKNMITQKYESWIELTLAEFLKCMFAHKKNLSGYKKNIA